MKKCKGTEEEGGGGMCGGEEDGGRLRRREQTFEQDKRNDSEGGREGDGEREGERWSGQESKPLTCRIGAAAAAMSVCVCVCGRLVDGDIVVSLGQASQVCCQPNPPLDQPRWMAGSAG